MNYKIKTNVVLCDWSSFKFHRNGSGLKGGQQAKGKSITGIATKLHLAITPDFHIIEGFVSPGNAGII